MFKVLYRGGIIVMLFAATFFMYQDTAAQDRGTASKPELARVAGQNSPDIAYTVSMPLPATHLLEVEMRIKHAKMPARLSLKMPVWTPGSYLVREYARHVQDFSVKSSGGAALTWAKVNKNTWDVDTNGSAEILVSYKVYANELTVRTNELNSEHAFWNNGALLLFPAGQLSAPSTVTVKPYGNWKIATGLPPVAGQTNTFRSPNYDILYDSPFEVSDFHEISFSVKSKPHRLVITGDGNYDLKQLAVDIAKIADAAANIFGELPVENYTFIVNLRGGGGLEHLNSTALQFNRFGFKPQARYRGFLGLVAHEYFHLWNVKRIRPDALGPFDYENENYTKLLWVAEGATAYYESVLLRRAGFITDKEFLADMANKIGQLERRPGRFETSLEEASMDAWIKYYRQDENSVNNQISYYDKGEIVNMMLDITIRTASDGSKSLDDVMRYLYNEFYKKNRNYTPKDFQNAAELAAGKSLDDFFTKYVRGETEIDYADIVNGIGLKVNTVERDNGKADLGADLADENGRLNVRSVAAGTPAYSQGLNFGDQIVAIDGYRASNAFLQSYLAERKPGDKIKLTLFRFDRLMELPITLGNNTRADYSFAPMSDATDKQRQLYDGYLGGKLAALVEGTDTDLAGDRAI